MARITMTDLKIVKIALYNMRERAICFEQGKQQYPHDEHKQSWYKVIEKQIHYDQLTMYMFLGLIDDFDLSEMTVTCKDIVFKWEDVKDVGRAKFKRKGKSIQL